MAPSSDVSDSGIPKNGMRKAQSAEILLSNIQINAGSPAFSFGRVSGLQKPGFLFIP